MGEEGRRVQVECEGELLEGRREALDVEGRC